jgi:hypothetical protein
MKTICGVTVGILCFIIGLLIGEEPKEPLVIRYPGDSYQKVRGYNFEAKGKDDQWLMYDPVHWDSTYREPIVTRKDKSLDRYIEDLIEEREEELYWDNR